MKGVARGFAGALVSFANVSWARKGRSWPSGGLSRHLTKHYMLVLTPQRGCVKTRLPLSGLWGACSG